MLPRPLPRRRRNSAVSIWLSTLPVRRGWGRSSTSTRPTGTSPSTWCRRGVFLCTKHEARHIREHGRGGAIVNVSSLNAHVPSPYGSAYATGKAGVEMFSKNAAIELAASGIRVNAVLPGLGRHATGRAGHELRTRPATCFSAESPCPERQLPTRSRAPASISPATTPRTSPEPVWSSTGGWEVSNYPDLTTLGN